MSKNVLILFSGGLDSTYLMWKNLKEGNKVYPVYFEITNNENKTIVEKQQIKLIISELEREFDTHITINYVTNFGVLSYQDNVMFSQPLIWAISMPFSIDNYHDEINVGYVSGDDAILYLNEIKQLYEATKPFTKKHLELRFPLVEEKIYKQEIVDKLPKQYHMLVSSCENPRLKNIGFKYGLNTYRGFEPCCNCVPCKKIIANDYFYSEGIENNYIYPAYKQKKEDVLNYENRLCGWKNALPVLDPRKSEPEECTTKYEYETKQ